MADSMQTIERLELFGHRVLELYDCRLVQSGMNSQLTISWDRASNLLKQNLLQPKEEDLRSFLLTFRMFVSDKEPVFLNRVFNDCHKHLDSDHWKSELIKARSEWNTTLNKIGAFALQIDGKAITGEYVLDLWINGHYFHNDSDKAADLRRYVANQNMPLVRAQFLGTLSVLTQVVLYAGSVTNYSLRQGLFHFN